MNRLVRPIVSLEATLTGLEPPPTRADDFRRVFEDAASLRSWLDVALPSVYRFVFARCGADDGLAQEITQETMVEVVRRRATFDGRADPLTWVCGIARHKIADHFRAKYRDQRLRSRLVERRTDIPESEENVTVTHEAVVETLRALPESQRVVLALHYLDAMPVHEIAERLGRSESAVESLLARGRDTFRRAWGPTEEVDR